MDKYYLWLKMLHLFGIISWMAGLFYLPRLFVYHRGVEPSSDTAQLFQTMERRLYNIIIMPSMILSLATGTILAIIQDYWSSGWFHVKLTGVLGLVLFQFVLNHWRHTLADGSCSLGVTFFRIINEIPAVLLIIIIYSVVFKPF
jgi:putative membrane protein